ncbi:hypothetical protein B566_EDAN006676 [Ephemera danica]|nr:hypothetical protein B566_EDAN006676 [Ephemera danica]
MPSTDEVKHKYGPCPHCYAYFSVEQLCKHIQRCPHKESDENNRKARARSRLLKPTADGASEDLRKFVLPSLRDDELAHVIFQDPLILAYGSFLFERGGHEVHRYKYMRAAMREVASFLVAARDLTKDRKEKIVYLQELLDNTKFLLVVESAKAAAGAGETLNGYKRPQLAENIGYHLDKISELLLQQCLIDNDELAIERLRRFKTLLQIKYKTAVSTQARVTKTKNRMNRKIRLPTGSDLKKLHDHLNGQLKIATENLIKRPNKDNYVYLARVLQCKTVVFNRRRVGEVERLYLNTYTKRNKETMDPEVAKTLDMPAKQIASSLQRIETRGKYGRTVAVLLTKEMVYALDALVAHRDAAGVSEKNPYLFAGHSGSEYFVRAGDSIRFIVAEIDAEFPESLRSTMLRKHIATMLQLFEMSEAQVDQVARFMGHEVLLHKNTYRHDDATLQQTQVATLLLALERGDAHKYKGKRIDQIKPLKEILASESEPSDDEGDIGSPPRSEIVPDEVQFRVEPMSVDQTLSTEPVNVARELFPNTSQGIEEWLRESTSGSDDSDKDWTPAAEKSEESPKMKKLTKTKSTPSRSKEV